MARQYGYMGLRVHRLFLASSEGRINTLLRAIRCNTLPLIASKIDRLLDDPALLSTCSSLSDWDGDLAHRGRSPTR